MSEPDLHRGARIGTRIAHLVSMALVSTHNKLLDVKHRLAVMIFNTISNEISDEVHDTIGHLVRQLAEQTEKDGHSAPILEFLGYDRGQLKAIAGSSALSGSILWALGTIISNELAPATYANVAAVPHLAPDSATAGQMFAVGAVGEGDARYAMAGNGHGGRWQNGFIELAYSYPGMPDAVDLYRRNIISAGDLAFIAKKNGVPDRLVSMWQQSAVTPLSFQDVAVAYLRGGASLEAYHEAAKFNGISVGDANMYLESIGEPPGTMELLEAYRRGFIDTGTLQRGILQSRTRNEWIPVIEQLRYSPMSTADAVNAAVQNHISQGEAASIAQQNGLEPGHFDTLYQTAGAPLSRTELTELYNRGEIGSDVVFQGLRESRLKDKYIPDVFKLRRTLLEPRSLGEAVHVGALSHDDAIKHAMERGYTPEDAAVLVNSASNRKMQSYRDRLVSELETLFTDGALTESQITSHLASMGYSGDETRIIIETANYKREQRVMQGGISSIRSRFVAHHIDAATASNMLDGIGVQAVQRDYLLNVWKVEAAANVKVLTEAQIIRAIKLQSITPDDGAQRLVRMGYHPDDAALLIQDI